MDSMPESLNQCAGPFGAVYDFYIERPWLMQALGRLATRLTLLFAEHAFRLLVLVRNAKAAGLS